MLVTRDLFAAQIFGAFDIGARDEIVSVAAGKSRDDFEIVAGADGGQSRAAAAAAELNVPGCEARNQSRRAAQINLFDL